MLLNQKENPIIGFLKIMKVKIILIYHQNRSFIFTKVNPNLKSLFIYY